MMCLLTRPSPLNDVRRDQGNHQRSLAFASPRGTALLVKGEHGG